MNVARANQMSSREESFEPRKPFHSLER